MQPRSFKVVHYLNQFFAGVGGEEKAYAGPEVKKGPVGPGKLAQQVLRDRGEVVATIICGDNYFGEKIDEAVSQVVQMLTRYQPDIVIAGPAFNAGRYGIACGEVCKAAQDKLGIPAVTGMYKENPGVDLCRKDIYIVQTEDSVRGIAEVVSKMVSIACRLAANEKIGKPSEEGYFPRGFLTNEPSDQTAAERTVSMLLAKIKGEPFATEVSPPKYDRVKPAPGIKGIPLATIALVTDGGLVPKGNPDRIEHQKATRFGSYSIKGVNVLNPKDYEVSHTGYDSAHVSQDPHRLVPVDVMRDLEKKGVIAKLHETFYATTGVATALEKAKEMGQAIARQLEVQRVSGAILTST